MYAILILFCAAVLSVNSLTKTPESSNLLCVVPAYLTGGIIGGCAAGTTDSDNIKFYIATRATPDYNQIYLDTSTNMEYYNKEIPTYFIIHGWLNSYDANPLVFLKNQWLKNVNANIISVDWSCLAKNYFTAAVFNIQTVGFYIGKMIISLSITYNLKLPDTIVFGHSMGAHIAGFAGKYINDQSQIKLGFILASDPAGPCITFPIVNSPTFRLVATDAAYVQVFHCTGETTGTLVACGDADIYFNTGTDIQCGCGLSAEPDYINKCEPFCSHNNCLLYFIYSLNRTNIFKAKNTATPLLSTCTKNIPAFYDTSPGTYMNVGIYGKKLSGKFRVPTIVNPPHCYPLTAGTCQLSTTADSFSGGTVC